MYGLYSQETDNDLVDPSLDYVENREIEMHYSFTGIIPSILTVFATHKALCSFTELMFFPRTFSQNVVGNLLKDLIRSADKNQKQLDELS